MRATAFFLVVTLSAGLAWAQLPLAVGSVDSDTLPIRVYYNSEDNRALAEQILPEAEDAWASQIDSMGFEPPYTVNDDLEPEVGVHYYISPSDQFMGYALPLLAVEATARTDVATVMMISDSVPGWYLPSVVHHEFNHAVQESVDAVESPFAYEQITVAVTQLHQPDEMYATMLADFQESPHRALYHTDFYDKYYYHYGASLFSYFLEHRYGEANGKLLARMWNATPQDGEVDLSSGWPESSAVNEPDLLDAMTSVLAEDGVSFTDAFAEFAVSRYFVGARDDGKHIPGAGAWSGAEVSVDTRYNAIDLPISFESPHFAPEELGVSYIAFDLFGLDGDEALRLAFSGDPNTTWRVSSILEGEVGEVAEVELADDGSGTILIPGLGFEARVVLVVVNLGDGDYDSDEPSPTSDFVYSAALLDCGTLEVDSVAPDAIDSGDQATITVSGSGFPSDQAIDVRVDGDGVAVTGVVRRSDSLIDVGVEVAKDAAVGRRQLTIALECGAVASGSVRIVEASGCVAVPGGWLAGLLVVLALGRRRPRR